VYVNITFLKKILLIYVELSRSENRKYVFFASHQSATRGIFLNVARLKLNFLRNDLKHALRNDRISIAYEAFIF